MLEQLDAAGVRRWCSLALRELAAHRQEIDDLNVYPVPDGDTGTNLVLTFESVADALAAAPGGDLPSTVATLARAALLGARGNSGVILSQLLRGFADVFGTASSVGGKELQVALKQAADLAYQAVAVPVEGTILTVARAAADLAAAADPSDLSEVARAAATAATEALARTPDLLPALREAGVVDAGGRGLCVVLDALLAVITGEVTGSAVLPHVVPRDRSALFAAREAGSDAFGYEVQFLLDASDTAIPALREGLGALGDSLVVVGGDGLFAVHVHVNDVGAAVEAGIEAGRPHRIAVTRFADQIAAEEGSTRPAAGDRRSGAARAVVAVVPGAGLAELFAAAGAHVVEGGATMNPSMGQMLAAIELTGAAEVVLLPNEGNVLGAAEQAAREATRDGREVHVIPTRSPVQGLAALAVHDADRPLAEDAIAMARTAGETRYAEVTVAVRDAQTSAGPCRAGDVLGLIHGDVAVVGEDLPGVARELLDRLLVAGGELITLVCGSGCPAGLAEQLADHVAHTYPTAEVEVHDGGQPHYPLLIGVE